MSELVEGAKWLWEKFNSHEKYREELKVAISHEIREAITETEIYLTSVNRNQKRDFDREATLARKWSQVAAEVAPKDERISSVCLGLSRYWANTPNSPTDFDEEIRELIYLILSEGKAVGLFYRK